MFSLLSLPCLAAISAFPQDLKLITVNADVQTATFGWKQIPCDQRNGVLLGYEVKLHYESGFRTSRVSDRQSTYTISTRRKYNNSFPEAISVAGINEVGVGDHSPPLNLNQYG